MNKKAMEFVDNANKHNTELYGKEAAEFIGNTAINYSRVMAVIGAIPKTPQGMLAIEQVTEMAASLSAAKVKLLNIPADVMFSYLELGKKLADDTVKLLAE